MKRAEFRRCQNPRCQKVFLSVKGDKKRYCCHACSAAAVSKRRNASPLAYRLISIDTLLDVESRLRWARTKHPQYAGTARDALFVIRAELDELEQAVRYETPERVRDEALDVAATVLRLLEGDVGKNMEVRHAI